MRLSLLACLAAASLLLAAAAAPSSATENFEEADANQDGAVSLEEFKKYMSADHPANKASAVLQTGNKNGFLSAFTNSLVMIVATEIGDKTFFIAAIMAMKHNRSWVFLAVMLAMVVMTVLSVGIGFALPNLLPRTYTHYAAALLFVYFGVQLLREAPTLSAGVSSEFEEAEEEVDQAEESMVTPKEQAPVPTAGGTADDITAAAGSGTANDIEGGSGGLTARGPGSSGRGGRNADVAPAAGAAHPKAFTKVITTVFSVIFLAEWGDRSQIATIALAAAKDPVGVCVGGVMGHAVSTAIAVIGGRLLATRISERTVAYVGGSLFLMFAVHSFIVGPPGSDDGAGDSFFSFFAPAPKEPTLTGMTGTGGDKLL